MWNAIRSDLKEFATSIATDGTNVLENIDSKLIDSKNEEGNDSTNNSSATTSNDTIKDALLAVDPEVAPTAIADETDKDVEGAVYKAMLADAQVEAHRRMDMEVTYVTPLLNSEVNGVKDSQSSPTTTANVDEAPEKEEGGSEEMLENQMEDGETSGKEVGTAEDQSDINSNKLHEEERVDKPTGDDVQEDVIDDDEDDDEEAIKEYLSSFDIQSKTDEISDLLSSQPFLAQQFETLVPVQVTYEQFWQRYFYRCDPIRIVQEWEEEDERLRLQRQELIGKGVKSVQNMFGGALKAIKGVAEGKNGAASGTSIYEKYQAELEQKQKAMLSPQPTSDEEKKNNLGSGLLGGALGMLSGTNGRPPFVLNTTESDDEEVYEEEEESEEEEEEELSWGSDDEDNEDEEYEEEVAEYDDDDGGESNKLNESETIVFEDKQTTPDGVIQEIENLKSMLEEAQGSKHEAESKVQLLQNQVRQLNEQIKQERNDHTQLLQEEITKIRNEERALASACSGESSDTIHKITQQLDEMQSLKYDAEAKARELELQLNQCKEEMKIQVGNCERLLSEEKERLEKKHASEMKSVEGTMNKLKVQLETSKANQQEEKEANRKLKTELNECKDKLKKQSINFAKTLEDELAKVRVEQKDEGGIPSSSPQEGSSLSSAVDIQVNEPVGAAQEKAEEEYDEDGWGDSWSDDE